MKIAYRAFERGGKAVSAVIDAQNVEDAGHRLRQQGLLVAEIAPAGDSPTLGTATGRGCSKHRGRLKNLAVFTRQLQVLVSSGTRLVQALAALERQSKDAGWREIIVDVRKRVEEGSTFADALAAHPQCFDAVFRSLVSAGETGGKLDEMLQRLGDLTRQQLRLQRSIMGSLIYPALLLVVAAGVMTLMLCFLLPRFSQLYETLDAPLPPSTRLLMQLSGLARSWWWAIGLGAGGAAVGVHLWAKTAQGRTALHTLLVRMPRVGHIARSLATARLLRVIGVLVESHIPLLQAISLAREASGNVLFQRLANDAEMSVTQGESMSSAFARSTLIEPYVIEAVRNGEQTGQVGPLLVSVADFLDEENEVIVRSLMSILEPLILIGLGAMVGLVAIAMFMPLFDLTAMTEVQ